MGWTDKEEDDASKYLVQPSQPAPPARVAAPELPDYIRERLQSFPEVRSTQTSFVLEELRR